MASSNSRALAAARARQDEDLALLRANEESAPHIRKFLQWVRSQNNQVDEVDSDWPLVSVPFRPTDNEIEDLIEGFIELNGEM